MKLSIKLPTTGKGKPDGVRAPRRSFRAWLRRARSVLGYATLFLAAFFIFVWVFLPTEAIAWRISQEAKKRDFIVNIGDVSVSPFGRVSLHEVTWIYAPSRPGQIPDTFNLDRLDVNVSVWRFLFGTLSVTVDGYVTDSDAIVHAEYWRGEDESSIKINIEDLPLAFVPKLKQAVNTPVTGLFALKVDLEIPDNKLVKSMGTIEISCSSCTVSDGETPMYFPGLEKGAMAKGFTMPPINLGSLGGVLVVADGKAKTEGIETASNDIELKITGEMSLKDPFPRSRFNFGMKLLVTEALQERSEQMRLMVGTASSKTKLAPPDEGWLGYKLLGTVARPSVKGWNEKSRTEWRQEKRERQRQRDAERRRKKAERDKAKKEREKKKKAAAKAKESEAKDDTKDADADKKAATGASPDGETPSPLPTVAAAAAMNQDSTDDSGENADASDNTKDDEGEGEGEGEGGNAGSAAGNAGGDAGADGGDDNSGNADDDASGGEGEGGGAATPEPAADGAGER